MQLYNSTTATSTESYGIHSSRIYQMASEQITSNQALFLLICAALPWLGGTLLTLVRTLRNGAQHVASHSQGSNILTELMRTKKGLAGGMHFLEMEYEYSPVVRPLEHSISGKKMTARILADKHHILSVLEDMISVSEQISKISAEMPASLQAPFWSNPWLPGLDAAVIYTLIATRKPKTYLEVGPGNSTKFARQAISDFNLSTRIVSIDPNPREEIDQICDQVLRQAVETLDLDALASTLVAGDVVFVDNSHRGFQNSDVTVCLVELMAALPAGVSFGVHDICLPADYIEVFKNHFYNEQYYLAMYLLAGCPHDRVIMPSWMAARNLELSAALNEALASTGMPLANQGGSAFWFEMGSRQS